MLGLKLYHISKRGPYTDWHFVDSDFQVHFLEKICMHCDENFTEVYSDSKSALVQVMAWLQTGNKSLTDPVMAQFIDGFS